ncbi:MAG: hypothetical protein WC821_02250 [archaeon]|jgi:hypothetical protein
MAKLRIFGILFIFFFLTSVFAYQAPLSDYGFSGISLDKASTKECKELTISIPNSAKAEVGAGILSIDSIFTDYQNDSSYITVSINGGAEEVLWPESFSCTQNCWARVFVPSIKNETKINLCTVLGGLTKKVEITSNSFISLIDTPVLSITNNAPGKIFLGERAKMSIIVSNKGTKSASVYVQFVHPDTRAKVVITSFDIVEGESSATTTIGPNETKQFDYYIKPSVISSYNLPLAALFFTNIFGEKQVMLSSHPQMSVLNPNQIEISLVALNEQAPYNFKAIIKNNWAETFNGTIIVSPQTALQASTQQITILGKSEKEITFDSTQLSGGNYTFFATVTDTNNIYSSNKIELEVKQNSIPFEVLFAIIGIFVGAAIFAWIYFAKESN